MSAKRYLIFGAGKMGRAIAHDLLASDPLCAVHMVDANESALRDAARVLGSDRVRTATRDVATLPLITLCSIVDSHDVAIGAAAYSLLPRLTEAAITTGTHFCDLGGHAGMVAQQFAMQDKAAEAGVRILPDCGVAPGSVSVLAKYAIDQTPDVSRVLIRVGGLPQEPTGPLQYAHVFSINGLLGNYLEPTEIIRDGKRETVESLGGREYQYFDDLGRLEAAYTADGSSTLTQTYEGRVKQLDYKTLRYPGHWDTVRLMRDLGMFSSDVHLSLGNGVFTAREATEELLVKTLPTGVPDYLVLRVAALDKQGNGCVLDLIDKMDPTTGHSAMQRTTGYSASICAQMLASDEIGGMGVLKHEDVVPPKRFMEEWLKRGICVVQRGRL